MKALSLKSSDWDFPLTQFALSTGMGVSLYDNQGKRISGPFYPTPMGIYFIEQKFFDSDGPGKRFEEDQVKIALETSIYQEAVYERALIMGALPIMHESQVHAVLCFGWVFDHFTDSVECDQLSKIAGFQPMEFWQVARMQAGTSIEKFVIYRSLLETLSSTLLKQLITLENLTEAARVKDELLAIVSHELKTPITSMLLRLQYLRRSNIDVEKIRAVLQTLENSTQNLASLVDDLLDSARMLTGKFRLNIDELNLAESLEHAMDTVMPAATGKKILLESKGLSEKFPFQGDGVRLEQMFWNLIANAVKFTPENGTIWISISRFGANYIIQISDNGDGIHADFIPSLFDRFSQHQSTITSLNKGLGLGLSIVKHITELHGGTIKAESKGKGHGAVFTVTLPV